MSSAPFTSEERICELSSINAEVAEMIKQAGLAVNALTNRPLAIDDEDENDDAVMTNGQQPPSAVERQDAFKKHTTAFYTGVQSVTARLRRNVYGLEEAGIISGETSASQQSAPPPKLGGGQKPKEDLPQITNGGMGNLDVGWLNSKGNKVGAEKESVLLLEVRELIEGVVRRRGGMEAT